MRFVLTSQIQKNIVVSSSAKDSCVYQSPAGGLSDGIRQKQYGVSSHKLSYLKCSYGYHLSSLIWIQHPLSKYFLN